MNKGKPSKPVAGRLRPSTARDVGPKKPASKSKQRTDVSPNRDIKEVIKGRGEGSQEADKKKSITLLQAPKPKGPGGNKSTRTIIRPETAKPQAKAEVKERQRSTSTTAKKNTGLGFDAK
jgi:hypothetical protein